MPNDLSRNAPVKRANQEDAPLEGSGNAVQIDSSLKNAADSNPWAGSVVDSIATQFKVEEQLSDTPFAALQTLFKAISGQKKQVGVIGPKQFITKLKQENGIF